MNDIANGIAAAQWLYASKTSPAVVAGRFVSCYAAAGIPGAGTIPGTGGAVCTQTDAGALPFTNPGASKTRYLGATQFQSSQTGTLLIFDRLVHNGAFSGTVTTAQAMTTPAITRPDANGAGVELWVQVYTALGATASTLSISYTNENGVAGRTATIASRSWANAGELVQAVLQAGDLGVRSVQSVTLGTSTGTAGSLGVVLMRRVAAIPLALANVGTNLDALALALPVIQTDAHLSFVWLASGSTAAVITGALALIEG